MRYVLLGILILSLPSVKGDIILGNISESTTNASGLQIGINGTSGSRNWAMSFIVGNTSVDLGSIDLPLNLETDPGASGIPILQIRGDDAANGHPDDNVLVAFNIPAEQTGIQLYSFSPTSSYTLAANTTYWLFLSEDDNLQRFTWRYESPGITPSGDFATYGATRELRDGSAWLAKTTIFNFQINDVTAAVPEPATYASFLVTLAGIFWVRRKIRRIQSSVSAPS